MARQLFLVFLAAFLILAQSSHADEPKVMSARELAELRRLVNPQDHIAIVFIPGILGSKLTVDGKEVWGGVFNFEPELVYDPAKPASAEVFDKVEVNAIVKKFGFNVYGNAIQDLRDQFTDASTEVFVFAYDWRQSNTVSARQLNERFCAIAEENGKGGGRTSFIVAAHSMGGIVLKYWLGNYWDKGGDCKGFKLKDKAQVERLFFLGTPHVGATKFVESLIDDYKLGEGNEWFGRLLASGLNKYGASFESVYELLPIFQSERCRLATANGASLPQYIFMKVDAKPRSIDIFDRRRWRDLGIPKQLPPLPEGENYYETFLPRQLGRAEEMLCGMMQSGYGSQSVNSVFFYGRAGMPTTIDAIVLTRYRNSTIYSKTSSVKHNPDDVVIEERATGYGDGTVLEDVAGAVGMVDPQQAHMSQFVHASLPDDPSFRKQLDWTILRTKAAQVQKGAARPDGLKRVMSYMARNRVRLPDGEDAVFVGRDAVATWAAATNLAAFPDRQPIPADRAWAANNRGHALIVERDFTSAEIVMRDAAEKLLAEPRKDRALAAKLLNNYGWALLRLGRFDVAEKCLRAADVAGNSRARLGLTQIAGQRNAMKQFGRAAILLENVQ